MSSFNSELLKHRKTLQIYTLKLTRNSDDAEDLLQETLLKALAGRDTFTLGSNMVAWLARIMKNAHIDLHRRRSRRAEHVSIDDSYIEPEADGAQFHSIQLREVLRRIAQFPPGQRRALVLSVFGDTDYVHIARQTGVAVGTVKSRISRARKAMEPYRAADDPD